MRPNSRIHRVIDAAMTIDRHPTLTCHIGHATCERLLQFSRSKLSRIAPGPRHGEHTEAMLRGSESGYESKGAKPIDCAQGEPAWYAAWTRSHFERAVAEQLSARGFETFMPEIATRSRRGGQAYLIQTPMFPGYLFVRAAMDTQRYVDLLRARGLVRVLGDGWDRLAPIPDAEIDAIQRVVDAGVPVLPHAHLTRGDRVTVVHGPLAGV